MMPDDGEVPVAGERDTSSRSTKDGIAPAPRRNYRFRSVALWLAGMIASYGALLLIKSDTFFFVAIPGVFGLIFLVGGGVVASMAKPFATGSLPGQRDGSDPRAVVQFHRRVLLRRYLALASLTACALALPAVVDSDYVFPFFGVGVTSVIAGIGMFIDQMRWLRQCTRIVKVYDFQFLAPVQKLEKRSYGRRFLRVGGVGSDLPKMSARMIFGREGWPEGIAEGVWFAGDEPFGGAILIPSTGELMCMQPLDWGALSDERAQAGPERQEKAKQAGLDRQSM